MQTRWYEIITISLLLLIVALFSTYPLVHYFDTAIPFGAFQDTFYWNKTGDQLQLLYWFWLVKENLFGNVPFNTNPFEFIMPVQHATTGFNTFPFSILYILFSPFGDIAAYNCTILISYILSGLFMYLLVRLYDGTRTGAIIAAIIFTCAPSRINSIAGGNLTGFLFFLYPWIIYFLEKGMKSHNILYGFLSALGLVILSTLEPHLLYYLFIFFVFYFPFRFLLLYAPFSGDQYNQQAKLKNSILLSAPALLLFIWGAGVVAVFYSQALFTFRDADKIFTRFSPWIFTIYPLIILFSALLIALLLQRVAQICFKNALIYCSIIAAPLYLLLLLSLFLVSGTIFSTGSLLTLISFLMILCGLFALRNKLHQIFISLFATISKNKKRLYPTIPLLLTICYIVYWLPKAKTEKFASTIAAGGRTLHDVKLLSAKIPDIFISTSNVYLGEVTFLLLAGFLFALLSMIVINGQRFRYYTNLHLRTLFFVLATSVSYTLALGLSFDKSSLYFFLYNYFPYFNYPRISDRLMAMALFTASVGIGLIITAIFRQSDKTWWRYCVFSLCLILCVYQLKDYGLYKHMGISRLDHGQSIYKYVEEHRGKDILLEIPLWPGDSHQSSLYEHYIMLDKIPRVNGYSPLVKQDYINTVFKPLYTLNRGRLNREQYTLLRQLHVGYITVHNNRDVFPPKVSPFPPITTVRRLQRSPYLEQVQIDNFMLLKSGKLKRDNIYLFRVKTEEEIAASDIDKEQSYGHYEMPFVYDASRRLGNNTGEKIDYPARNKKVFHAKEGIHSKGYLVRGPFSSFPKGNYRCYFSIKVKDNGVDREKEKNIATLEIVKTGKGVQEKILAKKAIKARLPDNGFTQIAVDFVQDSFSKLEFRVFYHGRAEIWLDTVLIYIQGEDAPLYSMTASKMVGDIGQMVSVNQTTQIIDNIGPIVDNNKSQVIRPLRGNMISGPGRILKKGKYQITFSLRKQENTGNLTSKNDIAAILRVTDGMNKRTFAEKEIKVEELQSTFTPYAVTFTLNQDEDLNFHLFSTGLLPLQVDTLTLTVL